MMPRVQIRVWLCWDPALFRARFPVPVGLGAGWISGFVELLIPAGSRFSSGWFIPAGSREFTKTGFFNAHFVSHAGIMLTKRVSLWFTEWFSGAASWFFAYLKHLV